MTNCDVVVQVAMPATGAAMLTQALTRLRPQLHWHGIAVATERQAAGLPHARGWRRGPDAADADAAAFADELAHLAAAERSRAERNRAAEQTGDTPRLIVSGDRLLGAGPTRRDDTPRFRPYATSAIEQVLAAVSAQSAQIVLYTHRQDRLMELSYLSRVRAGSRTEFDAQFPYRRDPVLDYLELAERLRSIPRVADVAVRPWEFAQRGTHALVNDFLALLGLENQLDLYPIGADLHPYPLRYTAQGAELALAMNALSESKEERRSIREFLTTNFAAPAGFRIDLLDAAARRDILDCYADSNRALFERYLPGVPADSYLDDAATFALGNVLDQPVAPVPQGPRDAPATNHPRA